MAQPPNQTQLALLQASAAKLQSDPNNQALRTSILQGQVEMTAGQLGISTKQAGDVVRSYTAAYSYAKGGDPQALLDALDSAQQQILNYDQNKPKFAGMDLITANRLASYLTLAAGPLLGVAAILFIVGLLMVGPEAAAAALAAGSVSEGLAAVAGLIGGSYGGIVLGSAGILYAILKGLEFIATNVPMITKQMVDNGSIAPGLQITAIKNATEVAAKLSGTKAPGPYTSAQFDSLYNGLTAAGIGTVKNPATGSSEALSRQSLANLVNVIYGQQVAAGSKATPTVITPLLQPWLHKGGTAASIPLSLYDQVAAATSTPSGGTTTAAAKAAASVAAPPAPQTTRVFTGIVSQGALGGASTFQARPDDLIQSIGELETAAANNLAAFLAALPGRLVYEIKIVTSVTTSDGFTQRGTTQRLQSGTYANGTPKYRTVTNRFAVLKLYALTKTGSRSHLADVTLGPTDAVAFQPSDADIASVQSFLQSEVHTSDTSSFVSVAPGTTAYAAGATGATVASQDSTPQNAQGATQSGNVTPSTGPSSGAGSSIPVEPTADQLAARSNPLPFPVQYPTDGMFRDVSDFGSATYRRVGNKLYEYYMLGPELVPDWGKLANNAAYAAEAVAQLKARYGIDWSTLPALLPGNLQYDPTIEKQTLIGANGEYVQYITQVHSIADFLALGPSVSASITNTFRGSGTGGAQAPTVSASGACTAQSLSAFYKAQGQTLPSVASRSTLYASLGLGQASYYTGTAEQNTKLLRALQQQIGCAV